MKTDNLTEALNKATKSIYFKIAIVVVIVAIVYVIVSRLPKTDAYSNEAGRNIKNNELSFSNLEFENMSSRLLDAMSGATTDEETIYSILKRLNNISDWNKLIQVFGVRETTSMWSDWSGNLMEWIVDECDDEEQEEVRSILARIGVTF